MCTAVIGEMAPWLRELAALREDRGSVASTHIRQFVTICNSSPRVSGTLFWPLQYLNTSTYTERQEGKKKKNKCRCTKLKPRDRCRKRLSRERRETFLFP